MKFSIIIPVYNAAKHISECLDSCLDQGPYKIGEDYEIICINDGSKDNSIAILRHYQRKGIDVVDQENSGVSMTRNRGIELAKGDYLWFVDSDDLIKPKVLPPLYSQLQAQHAEGAAFRTKIVPESFSLRDVDNKVCCLKIVNKPPQMNNAFSVVISRKYINKYDIRFNTAMAYCEDTLFVFYLRLYNHNFIYFDNNIYFYRQVPTSAMHRKDSRALELSLTAQMKMLHEYKTILENFDAVLYSGDGKPKERYYWTMQNVLFSILKIDKKRRVQIFTKLKSDGHYPYPILWSRFFQNSHSVKSIAINLFCLFFPLEWYYRLMIKLFK